MILKNLTDTSPNLATSPQYMWFKLAKVYKSFLIAMAHTQYNHATPPLEECWVISLIVNAQLQACLWNT